MAKLNQKVLGTAAGAVGDLMFKTRSGKTYIATRPSEQKISETEDAVNGRDTFAFCGKLGGALNKIFWFKYIWQKADLPAETTNNKIQHINFERISKNLNPKNIKLLPVFDGFNAELVSFSFEGTKINAVFAPLGEDSGVNTNKKVTFQGIFCLSGRLDKAEKKKFGFVPFTSEDVINIPGEQISFSAEISQGEEIFIREYAKCVMVGNLLTKNKDGIPQNASINVYQE